MGFDVLKKRCAHRILSSLENCDLCLASARERAIAKAGPRQIRFALITGKEFTPGLPIPGKSEKSAVNGWWPEGCACTPIKTLASGNEVAGRSNNPRCPVHNDPYGEPWPKHYTAPEQARDKPAAIQWNAESTIPEDRPFGTQPGDQVVLLTKEMCECSERLPATGWEMDMRPSAQRVWTNTEVLEFRMFEEHGSQVEGLGLVRDGALVAAVYLATGRCVGTPGMTVTFDRRGIMVWHAKVAPIPLSTPSKPTYNKFAITGEQLRSATKEAFREVLAPQAIRTTIGFVGDAKEAADVVSEALGKTERELHSRWGSPELLNEIAERAVEHLKKAKPSSPKEVAETASNTQRRMLTAQQVIQAVQDAMDGTNVLYVVHDLATRNMVNGMAASHLKGRGRGWHEGIGCCLDLNLGGIFACLVVSSEDELLEERQHRYRHYHVVKDHAWKESV
jgi:hypothetical protein